LLVDNVFTLLPASLLTAMLKHMRGYEATQAKETQ